MKARRRKRRNAYPVVMGAYLPVPLAYLEAAAPVDLGRYTMEWPRLWDIMNAELRLRGYQKGTIRLYRHVLRRFARFMDRRPCYARPEDAREFISGLSKYSWSWISLNIAVLRTVFDKLGGLSITKSLVTPKRPDSLLVILSQKEVRRILEAALTMRDQLLLGLMYGCGLKVGEACTLRWRDIDLDQGTITVHRGGNPVAPQRTVRFPSQLLPVLRHGIEVCRTDAYVFVGSRTGKHLSIRMVGKVLRKAVKAAAIDKPVCGMTLRHSYAVHCLQLGSSIREVQEVLGHDRIETTMIYERCLLPENVVSPVDKLHHAAPMEGGNPLPPSCPVPIIPPEAIERPFTDDVGSSQRITDFYRDLKTHIGRRFLALRRVLAPASTGPPG